MEAERRVVHAAQQTHTARRLCARRGCSSPVKKATAKYCSVQCCSIDPERHERLRQQARRGAVLPMTRQLTLAMQAQSSNPEAQLALLCEGREDVPAGMSRLSG